MKAREEMMWFISVSLLAAIIYAFLLGYDMGKYVQKREDTWNE
jgi:hypothetical protein